MTTPAIPAIPAPAPAAIPAPTAFSALSHTDTKRHLLLACTGSVATIKLPLLISTLHARHSAHLTIHVLLTPSALAFLPTPLSLPGASHIWTDRDEWEFPSSAWTRGDPILHIELRRWADLLVIAPLGANSLAKIAGGLCDNLLLSVVRAWDPTKRIVVAPAMNTAMWKHPLTETQIRAVEQWGWVDVLWPVEKELACGDVGVGAMRAWEEVAGVVEARLGLEVR